MKQLTRARSPRTRRDRIRDLGFDPDHLTLAEQEELLELHSVLEGETTPPPPRRPLAGTR